MGRPPPADLRGRAGYGLADLPLAPFAGGLTPTAVSVSLPFVLAYRTDGLTALADPTRRAIFEHLAARPRAVGELASELPGVGALRTYLDHFWDQALAAYKAAVEQQMEESS